MKRLFLGLVQIACLACGAADGTATDLHDFEESAHTVIANCSWRGGPTDEYQVREPASCYNVFAWLDTRLVDHQLGEPCDAIDEPNPVLVRPDHPQLWGYYDRDKVDRFKILRFELLDSCP